MHATVSLHTLSSASQSRQRTTGAAGRLRVTRISAALVQEAGFQTAVKDWHRGAT